MPWPPMFGNLFDNATVNTEIKYFESKPKWLKASKTLECYFCVPGHQIPWTDKLTLAGHPICNNCIEQHLTVRE